MDDAQRASGTRSMRLWALPIIALVVAFGGLAFSPARTTAATQVKVVVVVGPVEGSTARYVRDARSYASLARSLGASVTEIYSPNATWTRVKAAAKGANIFIYLGHGNGYPSPYGPFSGLTRNGLGLNKVAGRGNSNVKYYGQTLVASGLKLAPNSIVLLNHLCYASGDSEWGRKNPTKSVAMQRADGYGTGFLRAGAKAVMANGISSLGSIISDLLRPQDDRPDLPVRPGLDRLPRIPLRLQARGVGHRLDGPVCGQSLLPLRSGQADRHGHPGPCRRLTALRRPAWPSLTTHRSTRRPRTRVRPSPPPGRGRPLRSRRCR